MSEPAKPRRPRRISVAPVATASVASAILAHGASVAENEEKILDQIDFREAMILFDKEHVKLCRQRFAQVELLDFIAMMRRAKKLDVDPLSDIWTAADGTFLLRAAAMFEYASRTGRYAPGEQPAVFKQDDALKGDENPEGLISCTVTIRVRAEDGTWHTGYGEAFWRDLVPLTGGQPNPRTGIYEGGWVSDRTGWASMGRTMLRKCAYVDALKKGFPELGGFYIKEEMESAGNQPATASQKPPITRTKPASTEASPAAPAARHVPTTSVRWANGSVEEVPLENLFATVEETFATYSAEQIIWWFENNLKAREDFWSYDSRHGSQKAVRLKKYYEDAQINNDGTRPRTSQRADPARRRNSRGVVV